MQLFLIVYDLIVIKYTAQLLIFEILLQYYNLMCFHIREKYTEI